MRKGTYKRYDKAWVDRTYGIFAMNNSRAGNYNRVIAQYASESGRITTYLEVESIIKYALGSSRLQKYWAEYKLLVKHPDKATETRSRAFAARILDILNNRIVDKQQLPLF